MVDVQARVAGAPAPTRVRRTLEGAAKAARSKAREVSVLFCADARMRSLNRRFRGKDKTTDVLAFPAEAGAAAGGFLGDIVISVPYAGREARRREDTRAREIDRLLVHGFLHLMGYDHETDEGQMDALEGRVRRRLGLASGAPSTPRARAAAARSRARAGRRR
jgi:probable rRNA maturation factor